MAGPLTPEAFAQLQAAGAIPPDADYGNWTGLASADALSGGSPAADALAGGMRSAWGATDRALGRAAEVVGPKLPGMSTTKPQAGGVDLVPGLRATWDSDLGKRGRVMGYNAAGAVNPLLLQPSSIEGATKLGVHPPDPKPPEPAAPSLADGGGRGDADARIDVPNFAPAGGGAGGRAVIDPGGFKLTQTQVQHGIPASPEVRKKMAEAAGHERDAALRGLEAAQTASENEALARAHYAEEARAAEAQREANEQRRQDELARLRAKREAVLEEANSPGAVVGKAAGGLFASLGVALGAYAATMTGQRNHALDAFNAFTENELKRQKMAADREDNYYSRMRAEFGDARTAEDMTRAAIHRAASMELEKLGAKAKGDFAKAKYEEARGTIEKQYAATMNALDVQSENKVGDTYSLLPARVIGVTGGNGPPVILGEGQRPESPEEPPSNEEFWARRQAANDAANEETFARFRQRPVWDGEKFVNSEPDKPAAKPGAARGPVPVFAGTPEARRAGPSVPVMAVGKEGIEYVHKPDQAKVVDAAMNLDGLEQAINLRAKAHRPFQGALGLAKLHMLDKYPPDSWKHLIAQGLITPEEEEALTWRNNIRADFIRTMAGATLSEQEFKLYENALGSYDMDKMAYFLRTVLSPKVRAKYNTIMSAMTQKAQESLVSSYGGRLPYRYNVGVRSRIAPDTQKPAER